MRNSKSLLPDLMKRITLKESEAEIRTIAEQLIESICGLSHAELLMGKPVTNEAKDRLYEAIVRINQSEPVQYVLNEAHFFGRKFYVDPSVLIPRPETEELVVLILDRVDRKVQHQRIVDIATGSGCIAITLGLELPQAETWGTDISEPALKVATRNAATLGSGAQFVKHDVLGSELPIANVDILVSNPPYIAESEMAAMDRNVLDYEPHHALFVHDSDPLVFYNAIAQRSTQALVPGGLVAVEINARYGKAVASAMEACGLRGVEVFKDIAGKDRFVVGYKGN